ncbi:bifunctional Gcp-like domain/Kae1-TsaD family/ATPase [Babesia duncani]|uniref:N(6)-L-threonylcarbamoyladenine synthase n=1 Tax=Babesia duncani TaxID=323732 RepID=A0AAD9PKB9_9APIC|nr:bifunctional Gcp-like domain/Kae1-TsaD family/ATPase [Babesia duncani]
MKSIWFHYNLLCSIVYTCNAVSLENKNRLRGKSRFHCPSHLTNTQKCGFLFKNKHFNTYGPFIWPRNTQSGFSCLDSICYTDFLQHNKCVEEKQIPSATYNILAIETSCDDTCAAVVRSDGQVLSNEKISQDDSLEKYGGIVPKEAKILHESRIDLVINAALKNAGVSINDIHQIAVTRGPGLELCLRVGYNAALELSKKHNIELVSENHIAGHCLSPMLKNFQLVYNKNVEKPEQSNALKYPYLCLLLSGGHSQIYIVESPLVFHLLVDTQDQFAGNVLDKCARELKLPICKSGGAELEKAAAKAGYSDYELSVPCRDAALLNFCFSGIQTQAKYLLNDLIKYYGVNTIGELQPEVINAVAFSCQEALFSQVLIQLKSAMFISEALFGINQLAIVGGVASNSRIKGMILKLVENWEQEFASEQRAMMRREIMYMRKYKKRRYSQEEDTVLRNPLSGYVYDYLDEKKNLMHIFKGLLDPNALSQILIRNPNVKVALNEKNELKRIIHHGYYDTLAIDEFEHKRQKIATMQNECTIQYPKAKVIEKLAQVPMAPKEMLKNWIKRGMYLYGRWQLFSTTREYCTDNAVMIANSLLEKHGVGVASVAHVDYLNGRACGRL